MVTAFYTTVFGNALDAQISFIQRLERRVHVRQVNLEEECDFILAFMPVVSRTGTDLEAALAHIERNQTRQPVVLVVLHHTFDVNHVIPDSKFIVRKDNVFTVDIRFHEDQGLLTCLANDIALKSVTDYLISIGASPSIQYETTKCCRDCSCLLNVLLILFGFIVLSGLVVIFLDVFGELHY